MGLKDLIPLILIALGLKKKEKEKERIEKPTAPIPSPKEIPEAYTIPPYTEVPSVTKYRSWKVAGKEKGIEIIGWDFLNITLSGMGAHWGIVPLVKVMKEHVYTFKVFNLDRRMYIGEFTVHLSPEDNVEQYYDAFERRFKTTFVPVGIQIRFDVYRPSPSWGDYIKIEIYDEEGVLHEAEGHRVKATDVLSASLQGKVKWFKPIRYR